MFEYTLSKRFLAVCLLLVLAVSCTLTALADAEPPGESPAPESSAVPDVSPQPEETPPPSAEPGPSESPAPVETPLPSEMPAPAETPPPEETPAPTETPPPSETPVPTVTPTPAFTPVPTNTPAPTEEPEPEYTLDGALDFLVENGVSFVAASAPALDVGTDVMISNFPGTHRVYLGRYSTDSLVSVDVSKLLPDLYSRLVVFNFSFEPVSIDISEKSLSGTSRSAVSYDAVSGILSCPLLYTSFNSKYAYMTYDVFCYYNDSISDNSVSAGVTNYVSTNYSVGTVIDFPNFPGLHCKYVCSISGLNGTSLNLSDSFPDDFSLLTLENFSFMFGGVSDAFTSLPSPLSVMPSFSYESSSGIFSFSKSYNYLGSKVSSGTTDYKKAYITSKLWVFYNEVSEMVLPEPTPTPDPTPSPTPAPGDTPVIAPHPFWTTPFADYSVTEGMLLLLFSLLSLFAVVKVFRR